MNNSKKILFSSFILSIIISAIILANGLIRFRTADRSVVVKGLAEKEYLADLIIWPIGTSLANNNSTLLYQDISRNVTLITNYLVKNGVSNDDITITPPKVTDRYANAYGDDSNVEFRYVSQQYITVFSTNVNFIRSLQLKINELGQEGVVFLNEEYGQGSTQYFFTKLNDIKPQMIEEATQSAREVAERFAKDSHSKLGKIKTASQGQFTISDRDTNNPHLKNVRVVTTIEYYLVD